MLLLVGWGVVGSRGCAHGRKLRLVAWAAPEGRSALSSPPLLPDSLPLAPHPLGSKFESGLEAAAGFHACTVPQCRAAKGCSPAATVTRDRHLRAGPLNSESGHAKQKGTG